MLFTFTDGLVPNSLMGRHSEGAVRYYGEKVETKIPNFNTLSTLVDRLSIENVKLAHFENSIEHDNLAPDNMEAVRLKVEVQHRIITALKQELVAFMEEAFLSGRYDSIKEERTFQ